MRVQLNMSKDKVNQIKELKDELGIKTMKEFFNYALMLFLWVIEERRSGWVITSLNQETGEYKELALPALSHFPIKKPKLTPVLMPEPVPTTQAVTEEPEQPIGLRARFLGSIKRSSQEVGYSPTKPSYAFGTYEPPSEESESLLSKYLVAHPELEQAQLEKFELLYQMVGEIYEGQEYIQKKQTDIEHKVEKDISTTERLLALQANK